MVVFGLLFLGNCKLIEELCNCGLISIFFILRYEPISDNRGLGNFNWCEVLNELFQAPCLLVRCTLLFVLFVPCLMVYIRYITFY